MTYSWMQFFKLLAIGTLFFIIIDMIWLGYLMKNFYKEQLGILMRSPSDYQLSHIMAAGLVWVLIVVGCIVFVLPHTHRMHSAQTFFYGALYGLVIYGVYDLTNYAIIKNFNSTLVYTDVMWGCFASGVLTVVLTYVQ